MAFISYQDVNFERYDAIVAGSGPAGAVTAKTLAAKGKNVLVLESGGREFDANVQDAFASVYSQGHYTTNYWSNHWVRALGGTSAVWAGWVTPLLDRNFADWPLSRSDLDPWYTIAAEELLRDPIINSWSAQALPGFDLRPFSQRQAAQYGDEAGAAIWANENVHVLLNATLSRLHPRQDRRGIEKITLFIAPDLEAEIEVQANQSIVLAAGGMGNSQILLASDGTGGAAVGNESDQVGRYLMEHPHLPGCATLMVRNEFNLPTEPANFGPAYPALVPDDTMFQAAGQLDANFELIETDIEADDAIQRFVVEQLGGQAKAYTVFARAQMTAAAENRVQRMPGQDPAGLPRLKATCLVDAASFRAVLFYLEALGKSLAAQNTGRIRINDADIMSGLSGGGHTIGTTRMGEDPKTSVTDADCRVHGYQNLFVAGSSLFPSGGYANPTLTIIALAARLGTFLGEDA